MRGKMWRDAFGVQTYLVELVAEVDRVDVVAFEVGEHNDLQDGMPICRERGGAVSRRSSCDRIKCGVSRSQHGRAYRQLSAKGSLTLGMGKQIRTKKTMVKRRTAESSTDRRKSQPVDDNMAAPGIGGIQEGIWQRFVAEADSNGDRRTEAESKASNVSMRLLVAGIE